MNKQYILFGIVAALLFIIGFSVVGMTTKGEAKGCSVQPYEISEITTGNKDVCKNGDLVNVYDSEGRPIVYLFEVEGSYPLNASEGKMVYECYSCPKSNILIWVGAGCALLLGAVVVHMYLKRR